MTTKTTASAIGAIRVMLVAPATCPLPSSSRTDIADMPVKCMPQTATPITMAEPKMAAPVRTVTDRNNATVAATTAIAIDAPTRSMS